MPPSKTIVGIPTGLSVPELSAMGGTRPSGGGKATATGQLNTTEEASDEGLPGRN